MDTNVNKACRVLSSGVLALGFLLVSGSTPALSQTTYYEVWRSTGDDLSTANPLMGPDGTEWFGDCTSIVDETATPGTAYYYWIRAIAPVSTTAETDFAGGTASLTITCPSKALGPDGDPRLGSSIRYVLSIPALGGSAIPGLTYSVENGLYEQEIGYRNTMTDGEWTTYWYPYNAAGNSTGPYNQTWIKRFDLHAEEGLLDQNNAADVVGESAWQSDLPFPMNPWTRVTTDVVTVPFVDSLGAAPTVQATSATDGVHLSWNATPDDTTEFSASVAGKVVTSENPRWERNDILLGGKPAGVLVADADDDRQSDLIVGDDNTKAIRVLYGSGDRQFSPPVTLPESGYCTSHVGFVCQDFNGDGRPDLATADHRYGRTVSIYLGQEDGSLAFERAIDVGAGSMPAYLVAGYFAGDDGILDLAVTRNQTTPSIDQPSTVGVLRGLGDGDFAVDVDLNVGIRPYGIASADLDNDGLPDLAVANNYSDSLTLFYNSVGGFGAGHSTTIAGVGDGPYCVVARGDLNGDGRCDLAVANEIGDNVAILYGLLEGGFSSPELHAADLPVWIVSEDFDLDSRLDLAFTSFMEDKVIVLFGLPGGGFGNREEISVGDAPLDLSVGHLNADSYPDLAVACWNGGNVSILYNNIPEPATLALLALGALPVIRRRRK